MARTAYLFSTFPALSTTFIQHQVRATQKLGLNAILISTRPPAPNGYHPQDKDFYHQTLYLNHISIIRYIICNLKALITSPRKYLNTFRLAIKLKDDFPWQRLRNIMHVAGAAVLSDILKKKNVVHIHVHFAFGAAGVALFTSALSDITYSITIHGSDVLLPRPLTEDKLKRAKFIVSNCRFHLTNLKKRYPSLTEQQFHIVRGGLEINTGSWSELSPVSSTPPLRILNVARLETVKAQDILIKACVLLKAKGINVECRIAGDGPERKSLETLIHSLNVSDAVQLLGRRYQDDVLKLYDWSHVVVLSSKSEGTPMTVIEAMTKARPVIVPDITALPEMVIDGQTGFLFEKESPEDLATCLMKLVNQPEKIKQMGEEGRKKAEKEFDLMKNAMQLMEIFELEVPGLEIDINKKIEE